MEIFNINSDINVGDEIYILVGMNDDKPQYDFIYKRSAFDLEDSNNSNKKLEFIIKIMVPKFKVLFGIELNEHNIQTSLANYNIFLKKAANNGGAKPKHRVTKRKYKTH